MKAEMEAAEKQAQQKIVRLQEKIPGLEAELQRIVERLEWVNTPSLFSRLEQDYQQTEESLRLARAELKEAQARETTVLSARSCKRVPMCDGRL